MIPVSMASTSVGPVTPFGGKNWPQGPEKRGKQRPAACPTKEEFSASAPYSASGRTRFVLKSCMAIVDDPVLVRFRAALNELYGARIERVVLFGSRARGDAHPESDCDVAVFLKDLDDRWAEADKIAITTTNILSETGAMIHAMPYRAGSYRERAHL